MRMKNIQEKKIMIFVENCALNFDLTCEHFLLAPSMRYSYLRETLIVNDLNIVSST
jgi:hypothetical protein